MLPGTPAMPHAFAIAFRLLFQSGYGIGNAGVEWVFDHEYYNDLFTAIEHSG